MTTNGNAKAGPGNDYDQVVRTVYFDPGQTSVQFDINVNDDDLVEPPESFQLQLLDTDGGLIGEPNTAQIFIEDNDGNKHFLLFCEIIRL